MRVLHEVSSETRHVLQRLSMESQHHQVRQRAHGILLSCQGFNTTALRAIFSVHRLTISHGFDAWEAHHFAGLYDKKRCGQPPKLTAEEQEQAQHSLTQHPSDISKVVQLVEQATSKRVSTTTVKRLVKKRYVWKRLTNIPEKLRRLGVVAVDVGIASGGAGEGGAARSMPGARGRGTPRIRAGRGVRVLLCCSTVAPRGRASEAASAPWSRRGQRPRRTWRETHGRRW